MTTLHPILEQLGYASEAKQLEFVKLLHATGVYGDAPIAGTVLNDKQAKALLENISFDDKNDALEWLHRNTQAHWLRRPPGAERYEVEEIIASDETRSGVTAILDKLGAFTAREPALKHYDHVLLLGAMESEVDKRLNTIKALWDKGVRFEEIYLLGAERPLVPEQEPSAKMLSHPTEMAMMEARYAEKGKHWPKELQSVKTVSVNTVLKHDGTRPNTADTIKSWASYPLPPGNTLVISSQPHIGYQHAAVNSVLGPEYNVETIGDAAPKGHVKIAVALDDMARRIDVSLPKLRENLKAKTGTSAFIEQVVMVDPITIKADPKTFQYRLNHENKNGVTHKHKQTGEWNPLVQGDMLLLYEYKNGDRYVVDGHHRVAFAKELRAAGKGPQTLPTRILREADGYTTDDARIIGAYKNFMQEFKCQDRIHSETELREAASVFHNVRHHGEHVHKDKLPNIEIEGELKEAHTAGQLAHDAFQFVKRGEVPVLAGAEVAKRLPDQPTAQVQVMEIIRNKMAVKATHLLTDANASWCERVEHHAPQATSGHTI